MQQYPDILSNPDGDPRIAQEQYEKWHEQWEEQDEKRRIHEQEITNANGKDMRD
jgi:hypothetical protein